jgi:hypothetical protein
MTFILAKAGKAVVCQPDTVELPADDVVAGFKAASQTTSSCRQLRFLESLRCPA